MIWISKLQNEPLGYVFVMDPDTHFMRDGVAKKVKINTDMYMGASPGDVQRWMNTHDVMVIGYDGGETVEPFDRDDFAAKDLPQMGIDAPSMLVFLVSAGSLVGSKGGRTPLMHDIRGFSPAAALQNNGAVRSSMHNGGMPHYDSALYYSSLLELYKIKTATSEDWLKFRTNEYATNTTTHQGHQNLVDLHTGNFDKVILSRDPFRSSVHPGCAKLREDPTPGYYEKTTYKEHTLPIF